MAVATGQITQTDLTGANLLYTDTGTGYVGVTSRILTMFDANGDVVGTPYIMDANLTQAISITSDDPFTFVCVVIDQNGTWTATVIYVADGFYTASFLAQLSAMGCDCNCNDLDNFIKGEIYLSASHRYATSNLLPASQAAIINANIYINNFY